MLRPRRKTDLLALHRRVVLAPVDVTFQADRFRVDVLWMPGNIGQDAVWAGYEEGEEGSGGNATRQLHECEPMLAYSITSTPLSGAISVGFVEDLPSSSPRPSSARQPWASC
jgi:hypothetical protein